MPLSELPEVDAVLISHDHYDHLDLPTVQALTESMSAPFVVPVGIGEHLRFWGVPQERIVELDWGTERRIDDLVVHCTPARHFSGRGLVRNTTQWASWAVTGPRHRVFFGGDTGYTCTFSEIGGQLGPFDMTILPIGAHADLWPDVHMTPEEAVRAHSRVVRRSYATPGRTAGSTECTGLLYSRAQKESGTGDARNLRRLRGAVRHVRPLGKARRWRRRPRSR